MKSFNIQTFNYFVSTVVQKHLASSLGKRYKFDTNSFPNRVFSSGLIVWFPNWSSFTSPAWSCMSQTLCQWFDWWWWIRAGRWKSGRIKRQYFMFQRRPVVNNRFLRDRPLANDLIGFFNGLIGATCWAREGLVVHNPMRVKYVKFLMYIYKEVQSMKLWKDYTILYNVHYPI